MSALGGAGSIAHGSVVIHGHHAAYRTAGEQCADRPVLVLVHGLAGDAATWDALLPRLGHWSYAIAPDLPGHGLSDYAGGDCSIAGYAAWLRDLLRLLDAGSVTVVGHSLGGGVAMQLAYLFPDLIERLVLVSAGGLGPEVSGWLRAATLPGAELVIPALTAPAVRGAVRFVAGAAARAGLAPRPGVTEFARGFAGLANPVARRAFLRTVRTSLSLRGQTVDARDRLYLTEVVPTQIIWGARDAILPLAHGRAAHAVASGSRLDVLEGAGHFPHVDEPARVDALMRSFVESTRAAHVTADDVLRLIRHGHPAAG
jgi:pimeloyl-ACP methyl ester carboxylesterase